ncbi:hypothetical protein LK12_00105 [Novosphingobium malaysiense]|uniref:DUF3999 domain-containing protein n=2 Tax=Novosphingobium malaysiense TaxID=1348853 RepID=A0A0B1ZUQ8_9SPHN|nr:hypothetical protein LK12_00105 [Novosphingobium malaysiense]
MPVESARGDKLQRLALPAKALIALRRSDHADLRVFDATGRAMPIAMGNDKAPDVKSEVPLPVHPIVGSSRALQIKGVTLRLDNADQARIVGLDGELVPAGVGETSVLGVLIDTRKLDDPVDALALDVDLPRGKPVTFTVEASTNLKDWSRLAEKVMVSVDDGQTVLGDRRIALEDADLRDRYVRVRWNQSPGDETIAIRAAEAVMVKRETRAPLAVAARGLEMPQPRDVLFSLPFATRLEGVRVKIAETDGVMPVTLFARGTSEESWHSLAAATLRGDQAGTTLWINSVDGSWRNFRLEADRRTAGFSRPPKVELLLPRLELLVRFDGTPPYRLAAGLADAPDTFLTRDEIAPGMEAADQSALPVAKTVASSTSPLIVAVDPAGLDKGKASRTWILWAVLVLGTLVLAFAAFRLLRGSRDPTI